MRVAGLWRYPVKSMVGESLPELRLGAGVHGDRWWAVHDVERGMTASARRLPTLLGCRARYAQPPGRDAGPGRVPPVVITLPGGDEVRSDDGDVDARLSAALGREVRLVALRGDGRGDRLPWRERLTYLTPGTLRHDFEITGADRLPRLDVMKLRDLLVLTRYATPPGSFVDLSPVHVLTDAGLATVGAALDGRVPDARRFRPNVLLEGAPDGLPEHDWTGADLVVGAVRLHVDMPTVRCVVPSREQADLPREPRLTRAVASAAGRYLGVYTGVAAGGVVRVGDRVEVRDPAPPGVVTRVAHDARRVALHTLTRGLDLVRR